MRISRRDFLKAAAAAAAAGRITPAALADLRRALLSRDLPRVIWLHGQGCDGCTISLLNSIHYAGIADVLTGSISLEFHNTVMAAAGDLAVSAAQGAAAEPGYILAVEGAIPTGASGKYCMLWPNMSMYDGLLAYAPDASFILAIGACASYGGVTAGAPNPTQAQGVGDILGTDPRLINILCDNVLISGFAREKGIIDHRLVREAAVDIGLRSGNRLPSEFWWPRRSRQAEKPDGVSKLNGKGKPVKA